MPANPPPLPGGPPPLLREQGRVYWIGGIVSAIAISVLLLMLLLAEGKRTMTQGSQGPGTAERDGNGESVTMGPEMASEISAPGQSEQATDSISGDAVNGDSNAGTENPDDGVISDAVESATEENTSALSPTPVPSEISSDVEIDANAIPTEPKVRQRTRNLNVGNGFVPLAVGQGNPLRVGNEAKTIVYVIDKSSSMGGDSFRQVAASLLDAIDALREDQRYAVILFDTGSYPLGTLQLSNASKAQKQETRRALGQVVPDGGTQPFESVEDALSLNAEAIVFLSDGDFGQFEVIQITQLNHSQRAVTTIHCVGIDTEIPTLRQLAAQNGNGAYTTAKLLNSP